MKQLTTNEITTLVGLMHDTDDMVIRKHLGIVCRRILQQQMPEIETPEPRPRMNHQISRNAVLALENNMFVRAVQITMDKTQFSLKQAKALLETYCMERWGTPRPPKKES